MLANNRIKFLDLHLVRHVALILVGRVEMARLGTRYQLDFLSHCRLPHSIQLDMHAVSAKVCQHRIDTQFVYDAHTLG